MCQSHFLTTARSSSGVQTAFGSKRCAFSYEAGGKKCLQAQQGPGSSVSNEVWSSGGERHSPERGRGRPAKPLSWQAQGG